MTMPHRRERLVRVDFTRKRGKHVGRPRKLTPEQIAHARDAIDDGKQTCGSMAEILGVDHSTLWRAMRAANDATSEPLAKPFAKTTGALMGGQNGRH
jgi:DNA invertase Pin-like site-specific DNA recombinase